MREDLLKHGAFSWFELMTDNVPAAKDFYTRLFGWQLDSMPMGDGEYWIVKQGGEGVGGIMAKPPQTSEAPSYWATYVTVEDVDNTAKLTTELGGKVLVPPQDIPEIGRFCVLQDPQGAVISVITYVP